MVIDLRVISCLQLGLQIRLLALMFFVFALVVAATVVRKDALLRAAEFLFQLVIGRVAINPLHSGSDLDHVTTIINPLTRFHAQNFSRSNLST